MNTSDYNDLLKRAGAYTPEGFYSTRDKLTLYATDRSREAFARARECRDAVKTREDFIEYRDAAKARLLASVGEIPYDKIERATTVGVTCKDGVIIEKLVLEPRCGVYITALLYMPENREGRIPAVLFQSGHAKSGKAYGAYAAVCMTVASLGIAVLAFDPIGQGERALYDCPSPATEHQLVGNLLLMNGESLVSYFLADALAVLDYLAGREEIDAERIGATGSSGGGTMTALLSAISPLIKATAPATFLTDRETYLYSGQPQDAEQIWYGATRDAVDHYELVSAFCPKPYMILGVRSDFFCIEGTMRLYETERRFYSLLDSADDLRIAFDDSTHAYTERLACLAAEFFCETLLSRRVNAEYIAPPTEAELTVTKTGSVFSEFPDAVSVLDMNRDSFDSAPHLGKEGALRLTDAIERGRARTPHYPRYLERFESAGVSCRRILWFTEERMPAYGVLLETPETRGVSVTLWEGGTDRILHNGERIAEVLRSGRAVFIPDIAGVGKCAPYSPIKEGSPFAGRMKANADLLFLGDSAASLYAFGLLRTIDMLRSELGFSDISLYTVGSFGVYADIIDKIEPSVSSLRLDYKTPADVIRDAEVSVAEPVNYLIYGIAKMLK